MVLGTRLGPALATVISLKPSTFLTGRLLFFTNTLLL